MPEGDAGSTTWAQVPEGRAGATAGRCPDLSNPGPPISSAAPDLGSPWASPVASHLKEVSKDPRAVPAVKESCAAGSAWTPRAGKLGRRLLGRRVPRPATQPTRAMRVSGRPMLLALLLLLSTVGDRGHAQPRGPADRQTLLRLLVELVQELKKFHIGDSKRLQLLGESDFALGRREATDYGADQEEQRVGECSSVVDLVEGLEWVRLQQCRP